MEDLIRSQLPARLRILNFLCPVPNNESSCYELISQCERFVNLYRSIRALACVSRFFRKLVEDQSSKYKRVFRMYRREKRKQTARMFLAAFLHDQHTGFRHDVRLSCDRSFVVFRVNDDCITCNGVDVDVPFVLNLVNESKSVRLHVSSRLHPLEARCLEILRSCALPLCSDEWRSRYFESMSFPPGLAQAELDRLAWTVR